MSTTVIPDWAGVIYVVFMFALLVWCTRGSPDNRR